MWARILAILSKIFNWLLPILPAIFNAGKEIAKFTLTKGSILTTFLSISIGSVLFFYNNLEDYSTAIIDNLARVQSYLQEIFSSLQLNTLSQNILYYSSVDILVNYLILFLSVFFGVVLFLFVTILITIVTLAISALSAKMFCTIYDKISKNINVEFS